MKKIILFTLIFAILQIIQSTPLDDYVNKYGKKSCLVKSKILIL